MADKKADLAGPGIGDYNKLEKELPQDYNSLLTKVKNKNPDMLLVGSHLLVAMNVIKAMKEAGVKTYDQPRVAVTNIVCSYDIGKYINLNKVVITLNLENIEYEPEQFPGLVYRIRDPKIVALLFSSGKIILTGGKNLEDIKRGLDFLEQKLGSIM